MANMNQPDARQIKVKTLLAKLMGRVKYATSVPNGKLANTYQVNDLFSSVDQELTPPLMMSASATPNLVVTVGAGSVTNSESLQKRTYSQIGELLPAFAGGTIQLPAIANGGDNIIFSPGINIVGYSQVASSWAKLTVFLNSSGTLQGIVGTPSLVSEDAALVSTTIVPNAIPIGYIVIATDGSQNVSVIDPAKIYQNHSQSVVRLDPVRADNIQDRSGSGINLASKIINQTGSAAAPSITFTGDTNTGFFNTAADQIGLSAGGTEITRVQTDGLHVDDIWPLFQPNVTIHGFSAQFGAGTEALPSITFALDTNTGMYNPANNVLGVSCGGVDTAAFREAISGDTSIRGLELFGDVSMVPNTDSAIKMWDRNSAFSVTMRMMSSNGGLRFDSSNGGTDVLEIGNGTNGLLTKNGSVSLPGYSFIGDNSTGIHLPSAGNLYFSTGAKNVLTLTATDYTFGPNATSPGTGSYNLLNRVPAIAGYLAYTGVGWGASYGYLRIGDGGTNNNVDLMATSSYLRFFTNNSLVASMINGTTAPITATQQGIVIHGNGVSRNAAMYLYGSTNVRYGALKYESGITLEQIDVNDGVFIKAPSSQSITFQFGGNTRALFNNDGLQLFSNNTVDTPEITWIGDTDTGIQHVAANSMDIYNNGSVTISTSALGTAMYGRVTSAASPSHTFLSDSDTGMFSPSANQVGFSCGGTEILRLTSSQNLQASSGSASTPAYSFIANNNKGMYDAGGNTVGFSTGSVTRLTIDDVGVIPQLRAVTGTGVGYDGSGYLTNTVSSIRYKKNVEDLPESKWQKVYDLRPVQFDYKNDPVYAMPRKEVGLIAEEVEQIIPNMVAYKDDGQIESVYYQDLHVLLLKAVQEQKKEIDLLKQEIELLKNK